MQRRINQIKSKPIRIFFCHEYHFKHPLPIRSKKQHPDAVPNVNSLDELHELAKKYLHGDGLHQNLSLAIMYLDGQFCYGMLFYNREEYDEAVNWFEKAAEQGEPDAQTQLGICYF